MGTRLLPIVAAAAEELVYRGWELDTMSRLNNVQSNRFIKKGNKEESNKAVPAPLYYNGFS